MVPAHPDWGRAAFDCNLRVLAADSVLLAQTPQQTAQALTPDAVDGLLRTATAGLQEYRNVTQPTAALVLFSNYGRGLGVDIPWSGVVARSVLEHGGSLDTRRLGEISHLMFLQKLKLGRAMHWEVPDKLPCGVKVAEQTLVSHPYGLTMHGRDRRRFQLQPHRRILAGFVKCAARVRGRWRHEQHHERAASAADRLL